MKKYLRILKTSFISTFEHRGYILSGLVGSLVGVITIFYIWSKLVKGQGTIGSYDQYSIFLYYTLSALTAGFFNGRSASNFERYIRKGDLGNILVKPVRNVWYLFFEELGTRLGVTLFIYLIAFPVIALVPQLRNGVTFEYFHYYVLFIFLTNLFQFSLYWAVGNVAFFWVSIGGLNNALYNLIKIFRGAWFPIDLAPTIIQRVFLLLPFSYTVYYPAKLLTSGFNPKNIVQGTVVLTISTIITFVFATLLWKKGIKKYENVGI